MGVKLVEDIIGQLSHNAGIVSLGLPAGLSYNIITIGGQQYRTGVLQRTITTDVTMSANGLYMVFAVVSGGVVQLRISSNFNSAGPSGFTSWKLVGALYANAANTAVFGSFVNIEGSPETKHEITESGVNQLTPYFAGFSAFTLSSYNWSRIGRHLFSTWRLDSVTGNATSARFPLPRGGLIGVENNYAIGTYSGQNGAANATGGHIIGVSSSDIAFANNLTSGSSVSLATGATIAGTGPTTIVGSFRTFIGAWSNTPLKDL